MSNTKQAFTSIPVINVSGLFSTDIKERQAVADKMGKAAAEVGFLYVTGHGVPRAQIAGLRLAAKQFLANH